MLEPLPEARLQSHIDSYGSKVFPTSESLKVPTIFLSPDELVPKNTRSIQVYCFANRDICSFRGKIYDAWFSYIKIYKIEEIRLHAATSHETMLLSTRHMA